MRVLFARSCRQCNMKGYMPDEGTIFLAIPLLCLMKQVSIFVQVDLAGRTPALEVATGPQTPLELAASVANAAPGHHHHSTSSAPHQDSAGVCLRRHIYSTPVLHAQLLNINILLTTTMAVTMQALLSSTPAYMLSLTAMRCPSHTVCERFASECASACELPLSGYCYARQGRSSNQNFPTEIPLQQLCHRTFSSVM